MDDSPYTSPRSPNDSPAGPAGPATGTPKTIGLLNMIFGSILLVFGGLCYGGGMLIFFLALPAVLDASKNALEQVQRQEQERIDKLQAELDAAEDEQEKASLQAQIDSRKQQASQLAQNPAMSMDTDKLKAFMQNPRLVGYFAADIVSAVLLNVLMLISGKWLTKYRAAGHKLAVRVFAAKLIRLVLLQAVSILFVMPVSMEMNKAFMESQQNNPFTQYGAQSMASGIISGVIGVVFCSIYPVIALWLLSRPHNKAACNQP